jgi:cytochrome c biogenesis protein
MLLGGKTPYAGSGLISEVKPEHRLSERNPTFRGNLVVAEGTQSGTAILSQSDGVLLQDLPFAIELKKFIVEHYSTGMPKLFASEVIIHDKATGEKTPARIEVNHPASYKGIEIYQSSFDDGGSHLKLRAVPMTAGAKAFDIDGTVGGSTELVGRGGVTDGEKLTLEFTALRHHVENFGDVVGAPAQVSMCARSICVSRWSRARCCQQDGDQRIAIARVSYKLRDAGQAQDFNYMLPVDTGDGVPVFLLGVRENPSDPFRYLRVPADEQSSMEEFMRLYAALGDPAAREEAVRRYVALAVEPSRPELAAQLSQSALRALALFAGSNGPDGKTLGGLQAISDFMEANVPEAERSRAGEVLVRILNGALFELAQLTRERAGLKPMEQSDQTQAFMTQAVLSLSDAQIYPAPLAFELKDFKQVQASVFQVARAPGKNIVYLGCALLILGVFAMLYVRERRVWVWLAPAGEGRAQATMALSSNRKTMEADQEFETLKTQLLKVTP